MSITKRVHRNPFEEWQRNRVKGREEYIENALQQLHEGQFDNVSSLATYIASLLTQHEKLLYKLKASENQQEDKPEPRPVSKSTLLRNKDYRMLLDSFMAGTRKTLGDVKADENRGELALPKTQMELARVRRDVERMTVYIEKLESEREGRHLDGPTSNDQAKEEHESLKRKYQMICQAFINLYSSAPSMDLFEIVNGNLVDHSSRGQVVVEAKLIEPIVEKLKEIDHKKI